jgi:hypothetical protein
MESSQSFIANVEVLNEKLRRESWYNTFFAKFSGNVDISKDDNGNPSYKPSGKPIEILNQFIQQGRDNMLIPFLKQLTGSPVMGDTVLKGTGEDQSMNWLRSYVNQYRKAVMKKSGSMSEQRQKVFKLYEAAQPQLSEWISQWENQSIFQAFYEGVSPNLSYGTNSDGLGLAKRFHPNWYSQTADGTLTTLGTEKYLKTYANVAEQVHGGGGNEATHKMGTTTLRSLRTKCMELKIPQIVTKSGYRFWAIVMHPLSIQNLWAVTAFQNAQREAWSTKMLDSPELNGAVAHYAGFCIYEDIVGIREFSTGVGTDGDTGTFFGTSTDDRFAASSIGSTSRIFNSIVFGNSAVGKGVAEALHFTDEVDDHKNTIEIGAATINGYNRADYVAEGVAGASSGVGSSDVFSTGNAAAINQNNAIACINESSLILATDENGTAAT